VNAFFEAWRASASAPIKVDGDESGLRLVMATPPPRDAIVEGTVTGPDGAPVDGALVQLGQGCCYAYATPVPAPAPQPSPPPAGQATTMQGSAGGAPSSGAAQAPGTAPMRPICYACSGGDQQQMTTGANGTFRFAAYAGPHQIDVTADGYARTTMQVTLQDNATTRAGVRLEPVPKADAVVHGVVTDASTGAPIANAGVSLSNVEWSRYAYATTGPDGSFRFTTLPGWSQLSVYVEGPIRALPPDAGVAQPASAPPRQYYAFVESTRLASGDNTLQVQLDPKPLPTVALDGYVVDPDNETGVPGATVNVWNQDTGDWGTATTDATGSYRLLVAPGHFTMNAWAQGHLPGALVFTILPGATQKRVDVDAPAGETRYAPCDAASPCPAPLPMMGKAEAPNTESGAATPTPASALPAAGPANGGAQAAASGADGNATPRPAAYAGSGGGLPPYRADAAGSPNAPARATNLVPASGAAAATLGLAGASLLALLARRGGRSEK
jgi:protocatechuate 3,4-dioxygenase beta subunit